jgi:hypothetical protein
MYQILKADIFQGWDVNRRYDATGNTTEDELTKWFSIAKQLLAKAGLKVRK